MPICIFIHIIYSYSIVSDVVQCGGQIIQWRNTNVVRVTCSITKWRESQNRNSCADQLVNERPNRTHHVVRRQQSAKAALPGLGLGCGKEDYKPDVAHGQKIHCQHVPVGRISDGLYETVGSKAYERIWQVTPRYDKGGKLLQRFQADGWLVRIVGGQTVEVHDTLCYPRIYIVMLHHGDNILTALG